MTGHGPWRRVAWLALSAATTAALTGCSSVGTASGAVAGAATGIVTANPAVGIGVGIAVQAATDEAIKRTMKRLHRDQQDEIARIAGELAPGETRPWRVKHFVPLENGQGQVRLLRRFDTALASCLEFAFSVQESHGADWYVASACRQGPAWIWATAEPAVGRWSGLQ